MSVIFILIGASILVAVGFLIAFIWSVNAGQYEDDYTPSVRMLFESSSVQKTIPKESPQKKDTFCQKYNINKTETIHRTK